MAGAEIDYGRLAASFGDEAFPSLLEAVEAEAVARGLRPEQSQVALNGAGVKLGWLSGQYDLAIGAAHDLGFEEKDGLPAQEQVADAIDPTSAQWLAERRAAGHQDELVIAPKLQVIGLQGTKRKPGLIPRFDREQGEDVTTVVYPEIWGQIADKDPDHDTSASAKWQVGVLLGDKTDPRDPSQPANAYDEPGLVYPGMTADAQRRALVAERIEQSRVGYKLDPATIAQIVLVNAQRRIAGVPMLDTRTVTRLPQYPDKAFGRSAYVPDVHVREGRLQLSRSFVRYVWDDNGVRRALRIPVPTES